MTNGNHDRAVTQLRSQFKIPVIAHTDAIAELGFAVDRTVSDEEKSSTVCASSRCQVRAPGKSRCTMHAAG